MASVPAPRRASSELLWSRDAHLPHHGISKCAASRGAGAFRRTGAGRCCEALCSWRISGFLLRWASRPAFVVARVSRRCHPVLRMVGQLRMLMAPRLRIGADALGSANAASSLVDLGLRAGLRSVGAQGRSRSAERAKPTLRLGAVVVVGVSFPACDCGLRALVKGGLCATPRSSWQCQPRAASQRREGLPTRGPRR